MGFSKALLSAIVGAHERTMSGSGRLYLGASEDFRNAGILAIPAFNNRRGTVRLRQSEVGAHG
jgi:hypothetical protein